MNMAKRFNISRPLLLQSSSAVHGISFPDLVRVGSTVNLSLTGLRVRIPGTPLLQIGRVVKINLMPSGFQSEDEDQYDEDVMLSRSISLVVIVVWRNGIDYGLKIVAIQQEHSPIPY